ncbi:MAG: metallophosphoesterase [Sphingomonas sp.]|nr:metallophosphoesterase [Sphingomonas sp.]
MWRQVAFRILVAALTLGVALLTPPVFAQQPARIVAVGDLHGDYSAWRDIARAAGIVSARGRWVGGNTTLVQTGDIADRGARTLAIIHDLRRLEREARAAGGRVIVLVGNHEAMNVIGDLRYVTPEEFAAFADKRSAGRRESLYQRRRTEIEGAARAVPGRANLKAEDVKAAWLRETPLGWVEHRLAWNPNGYIGRWVASAPAVVQIGGTVFVHGGLSAEYAQLSLDQINDQVRTAIRAADKSPTSIISDPLGPLWYRGLISRSPTVVEPRVLAPGRPPIDAELEAVLRVRGAKRLVVGHTPNRTGIIVSHGGRLIRIDSGNSAHYSGQLSYLEIVSDRIVPHVVRRSRRRI